ncbi:chemotaxis protein [Rhodoplanes elegans]|uniref:Chemotaxis protein n=1 Tax=Rhodoplanes elegans TaxID=29408 RepID=A0A327KJH8_9BRAD|nr:PAS domain-containing protein [Rhodoplanes elegans]MBK5957069.1 chemotaxis protein [Rhodoplanes elegans]RAI37645.1 chemotaxis protein [Rhodoplanes elegans]
MSVRVSPTHREVFFSPHDLIVSKTDLKGRITYANKVFCDICGYGVAELMGQPHSIIRHPDMPRAVFKLLWDTIQDGREVFAYVKNMAKNGDHYWVFAHVTPSFDENRRIVGYHSNRRVPERGAVEAVAPLYAEVLREEVRHSNGKDALAAGYRRLLDFVDAQGMPYDELVFAF